MTHLSSSEHKDTIDPDATLSLIDAAATDTKEQRKQRRAEKRERKRQRREQRQEQQQQNESGVHAQLAATQANTAEKENKNVLLNGSSSDCVSVSAAAEYRSIHAITINESDADIHPVTSFAAAGFPPELLAATSTFSAPTPIQAQCWPVLLQHRDCIAIAETGSGKTLGFVLPGLVHILSSQSSHTAARTHAAAPTMLILSPTRELAVQTQEVCQSVSESAGLRSLVIFGGVDKYAQKKSLTAAAVHTIVATPGRLLAHIDEGSISLKSVTFLVLDEADRMLDMGFEPDVRAILKHITSPYPSSSSANAAVQRKRQTLMFSATWPPSIQQLAHEFLHQPVHITIGSIDLKANHRISQTIEVLTPPHNSNPNHFDSMKQSRLLALLNQFHASRTNRVLIFVLYKREVEMLERLLQRNSYACVGVSGDKGQAHRTASLQAFKSGKTPLLIATDVAARGLDIQGIEYVINYTFPLTVEDYVHRIGRTGRGTSHGHSVTFFTRAEKHLSGELVNVLREAGAEIPDALLAFGTGVKRKAHDMYGNHYKASTSIEDGQSMMKKPTRVTFDD